jgi:hypothetical protein
MDGKLRHGESESVTPELHLPPEEFASLADGWTRIMHAANSGNTASISLIVHGASQFVKPSAAAFPAVKPIKIPHGKKRKLADAFVIAYFRDHPTDDPEAETIAKTSGGQFTAKDIRRTPTWISLQATRGRRTEQAGDTDHGANDDAIEGLKGTKPYIRDRRTIRRTS